MPTEPVDRAVRHPWRALSAIALAGVAVVVFWLCDAQPWPWMDSAVNSALLKVAIWAAAAVAAIMAFDRTDLANAIARLCLIEQPLSGVAFGIAATMPMGLAALTTGLSSAGTDLILGAAVLGPFAEELLFRGFLFQYLHRRAQWRVVWAVLVSALAFGAAHLTALNDRSFWASLAVFGPGIPGASPQVVALGPVAPLPLGPETIVDLLMPAGAGAAFAWLVYRTRSLWPAVGLHGALNFWSVLSHPGQDRLRDAADPTSIAQGLSLALAVLLAELQWRRSSASHTVSTRAL
jgi:membrane protease YdiL (CAAX protease family)